MDHEDHSAKQEIRRAKRLSAQFAQLQREVAALEPLPAIDPTIELDTAMRDAADEWLDAHLDANVRPTANPHHTPHSLRG